MNIYIHSDDTDERKIYLDRGRNTHEFDDREIAEATARKLSERHGRATVQSGQGVIAEYVSGLPARWMTAR